MGPRVILLTLLALVGTAAAAEAEPCRATSHCSEAPTPELHPAILVHASQRANGGQLTRQIVAAARADDGKDDGAIEMPWIWKQLRRTAYHHLPRKRVDRFDARLAPTVVSTGFDTVPGAGLQGRF